jgi:hypothetical protein
VLGNKREKRYENFQQTFLLFHLRVWTLSFATLNFRSTWKLEANEKIKQRTKSNLMGANLNKAFIQMRGCEMCVKLKGNIPRHPMYALPLWELQPLNRPSWMWFKRISSKWRGNLIVYIVMGKNTQWWTKNNSWKSILKIHNRYSLSSMKLGLNYKHLNDVEVNKFSHVQVHGHLN